MSALALAAFAAAAGAWEGHAELTRESLRDVDWLDAVAALPVTTRSDRIELTNPGYAFASRGELPGQTVSARAVLETYVDEPDGGANGPDDSMLLSWQQTYLVPLGGSSSRRLLQTFHPAKSVHFPLSAITLGKAPERAGVYFRAARMAFDRGDPYWGFRYAACLLHYIQDAAEPFQSSESSTVFMLPGDNAPATAVVLANYHRVFQGWVERRLVDSAYGLVQPLRGTQADDYRHPDEAVETVAGQSREHGLSLFEACVRFFDRRFRRAELLSPRDTDLAQLEPEPAAQKLAREAREALRRSARATRGMLALIRPIIRERFLEPAAPRTNGRPGAP